MLQELSGNVVVAHHQPFYWDVALQLLLCGQVPAHYVAEIRHLRRSRTPQTPVPVRERRHKMDFSDACLKATLRTRATVALLSGNCCGR